VHTHPAFPSPSWYSVGSLHPTEHFCRDILSASFGLIFCISACYSLKRYLVPQTTHSLSSSPHHLCSNYLRHLLGVLIQRPFAVHLSYCDLTFLKAPTWSSTFQLTYHVLIPPQWKFHASFSHYCFHNTWNEAGLVQ
jgi:hypothetical protein